MAARFPLSVSSFAGSINGARTVVNSLVLRASTGVSGGGLADGVSLHPVRIKRLRNISSLRMVGALGKITETRVWRNTWGRKGG